MSDGTAERGARVSGAPPARRGAIPQVLLLAAVTFTNACASHTAPPGFLPDVNAAQTDVHGGWIDLQVRAPDGMGNVVGELIAVTADSLWVLSSAGGRVVALPDIIGGQLVGWDSEYGTVVTAVLLGTLSTVSNGWFLLLTAPMWMIGGSVAAASQSRHPIVRMQPPLWMEMRRYARFPQGLPRGIDFRTLQLKR